MKTLIKYYTAGNEPGAGAGATDSPAREREEEAVKRKAGNPGSVADDGAMSGDLDGGGGIGGGTGEDSHLDSGDMGPTPDKEGMQE